MKEVSDMVVDEKSYKIPTAGEERWIHFRNLNRPYEHLRSVADCTVESLAAAIREFSNIDSSNGDAEYRLQQSITVNANGMNVIDGHKRMNALALLGQFVVHAGDITFVEIEDSAFEKALMLTLNNPSLQGEFTDEVQALLEEIKPEIEFFDEILLNELRENLEEEGAGSEVLQLDQVPEIQEKVISHYGDIWKLGEHVLMCGDATEQEDVRDLLDGNKTNLVFTDPPYNMNYKSKKLGGIENDNLSDREFATLILVSAKNMMDVLAENGSYYFCMSSIESSMLAHRLNLLGLKTRPLIWAKPGMGLGAQEYRPQHEVMLYGYKGNSKERVWNGGRGKSDLWDFDLERQVLAREEDGATIITVGLGSDFIEIELDGKVNGLVYSADGDASDLWRFARHGGGVYDHPTQKPVDLIKRAIAHSSNPGDIVLDCFAGSGSTLIASDLLNRKCFLMEKDPKYCDVIIRRWEAYQKDLTAVHKETNKTFEGIENER